jgi:Cof subfamily protein (haloacid dehalogenase superfamily)
VIQLVALDLDGTLIDDVVGKSSARVRQAISAAQARGVVVTLATGRMFEFTLPYARDLNITAPLICYQGGLIRSPDSEFPLYRATMDPALVREVLEWRDRHDRHLILYADDRVFLDDRRHPQSFYREMLGDRLVWLDDISSALEQHKAIKFLVFVEPHETNHVETELRQLFGTRLEVTRSHAQIVEGNGAGVSKGDALRRLAAHLGVPQARVMAVGDQDNDASMIAWAGVGVAMGNGSPATKAVADWIAPPVTEDGAAVAIERFVLNDSFP